MSAKITISIIEDNANYIRFLKELIQLEDHYHLSQVYLSAEDFLQSESEAIPSIFLLDLNLPGKHGLSLVPTIQRRYPQTKILVLTGNDDHLQTLEAIKLGVSGYILKDAPLQDIQQAIHEVHDGGCVIDPKLSKLVLQSFTQPELKDNPLSQREIQVLELLALGRVKKEIAVELDLSYRAIALYTENIYKKLQVSNVAAAVATAIRKGLI